MCLARFVQIEHGELVRINNKNEKVCDEIWEKLLDLKFINGEMQKCFLWNDERTEKTDQVVS